MNKEGIMEDDRKGTWADVTGECTLKWWEDAFDGTKGHIDIQHDGQRVAIVGHQVNADVGSAFGQRGEYRVITTPDGTYSGTIKVEHFIPDPEPVIAYKAVIEVDGEWVSTWAGGRRATDQERLSYEVGQIVTATQGPGVACFRDLESAHEAYPSEGERGANSIPRNNGRLGILEVQTIGEGKPPVNLYDAKERGIYCYPSVKVLSVAWEKEEWVDITAECKLTFKAHESGHYIRIGYDDVVEDKALGYVGDKVEMNYPYDYRITAYPRKVRGDYDSGCIKVEKRND